MTTVAKPTPSRARGVVDQALAARIAVERAAPAALEHGLRRRPCPVGETIAPSRKHAAHGRPGIASVCDQPDHPDVNATSPIASCRIGRSHRRKSIHDAVQASP